MVLAMARVSGLITKIVVLAEYGKYRLTVVFSLQESQLS